MIKDSHTNYSIKIGIECAIIIFLVRKKGVYHNFIGIECDIIITHFFLL